MNYIVNMYGIGTSLNVDLLTFRIVTALCYNALYPCVLLYLEDTNQVQEIIFVLGIIWLSFIEARPLLIKDLSSFLPYYRKTWDHTISSFRTSNFVLPIYVAL